MLIEHKLIDNNRPSIRYVGLAEGPGGFVECFINYRRSCFKDTYDYIYCITLKESTTCSYKKEGHQTFHEKPRLSFWAVGEQFKTCRKSFPDVLLRTQ
mgnify:CR=1 FL=1